MLCVCVVVNFFLIYFFPPYGYNFTFWGVFLLKIYFDKR